MKDVSGMSLIEILISLLLLSILLLGFDAMQIKSLQVAKQSYFYTIAEQQLDQIIERLLASKTLNSADQIAAWNRENINLLPQGRSQVVGRYPHYTISIMWGGMNNLSCPSNKIGRENCLTIVTSL